MPRPDDPGSQGKGRDKGKDKRKSKRAKTLEFWLAKGWTSYTFLADEDSSDLIVMDPDTQDLDIKGHPVFGDDGSILKRSPHMSVVELAGGAKISLSTPVQANTTILYKIVAEEEDEGEDFDSQTIP